MLASAQGCEHWNQSINQSRSIRFAATREMETNDENGCETMGRANKVGFFF
jgi:hypothetical protein